jgi:phospho-N-acetylmuramoyl-pentapeptide-transferase
MLYELFLLLEEVGGPALFRFITTRSIFAFLTAFTISLLIGPALIRFLYRRGFRSHERSYGSIDTSSKAGTPLLGGILIIIAVVTTTLLWCDLDNGFVIVPLVAGLYFGAMGLFDDVCKVRFRDADRGMSRSLKYLGQIGFGLGLAVYLLHPGLTPLGDHASLLYAPLFKVNLMNLGWLYAGLIVFMIVYSVNAVNFADGMDGLAIVPALFLMLVMAAFAYVHGRQDYAEGFLFYAYLPGAGELTVLASAFAGAAVGFLWFNANPAEIFMGDTGSMFLGGAAGTMAVMLKEEVIFVIAGGIFVVEIASTAMQEWVGFSILKRRILPRAPIHHTFQHRGLSESKVVVRFWIVAALLAAIAIVTMRFR